LLIAILQGKRSVFRQDIEQAMHTAAKAELYEEAARFRDQLFALDESAQQQNIVFERPIDADVVGFAYLGSYVAGSWWRVREGAVQDVLHAFVELPISGDYEAAELQVLHLLCPQGERQIPLVLEKSYTADVLAVWFGAEHTPVLAPNGIKKICTNILQLAKTDAEKELAHFKETPAKKTAVQQLQDALSLPTALQRIECYDISHLGGTGTVASMIVFLDGKAAKNHYRRFSLDDTPSSDDYEAMATVLTRRTTSSTNHETDESFSQLPSLIVVDGGKGQLERAQQVLSQAGNLWDNVPVISLAKRQEEVFLPHKKIPLNLSRNHSASLLLQRIRDEAHRFAVTYQRKKRTNSLKSTLEIIPGIGPKTITLLRTTFGSLNDIQEGDFLKLINCIGKKRATIVMEYLLGNK